MFNSNMFVSRWIQSFNCGCQTRLRLRAQYEEDNRWYREWILQFNDLTGQLCYFVNTATPSKVPLNSWRLSTKNLSSYLHKYGSTELAILELGQFEDKKTLETCTVDKMYHHPTFTQRGSDGKFLVCLVHGSNADVINEVFDAPSTTAVPPSIAG